MQRERKQTEDIENRDNQEERVPRTRQQETKKGHSHQNPRTEASKEPNKEENTNVPFYRLVNLSDVVRFTTEDPLKPQTILYQDDWIGFREMMSTILSKQRSLYTTLKCCFRCNLLVRESEQVVDKNPDLVPLKHFWGEEHDLTPKRHLTFKKAAGDAESRGLLKITLNSPLRLPILVKGPWSPFSVHKCGRAQDDNSSSQPTEATQRPSKPPEWFKDYITGIHGLMMDASSPKLPKFNYDRVASFLKKLRQGITDQNSLEARLGMQKGSSLAAVDAEAGQSNFDHKSLFYIVDDPLIDQKLAKTKLPARDLQRAKSTMLKFSVLPDPCYLILTLNLIKSWRDLPKSVLDWLTADEDYAEPEDSTNHRVPRSRSQSKHQPTPASTKSLASKTDLTELTADSPKLRPKSTSIKDPYPDNFTFCATKMVDESQEKPSTLKPKHKSVISDELLSDSLQDVDSPSPAVPRKQLPVFLPPRPSFVQPEREPEQTKPEPKPPIQTTLPSSYTLRPQTIPLPTESHLAKRSPTATDHDHSEKPSITKKSSERILNALKKVESMPPTKNTNKASN